MTGSITARGWRPLRRLGALGAIACLGLGATWPPASAAPAPPYTHVFVIPEENKDYELIMDGRAAPDIARLARTYGVAENFFGVVSMTPLFAVGGRWTPQRQRSSARTGYGFETAKRRRSGPGSGRGFLGWR
jgi:hypothetical protein